MNSPRATGWLIGMALGIYGLRAPGDIDAISSEPLPPGPFERHDNSWRDVPCSEILQDPARHFRFAGVSIVSLPEVASLKRKRLAGQDREDLLLIAPLLAEEEAPPGPPGVELRLLMAWLRMRRAVIRLLMRLGVGQPLRRIYRRIHRLTWWWRCCQTNANQSLLGQ